MNREADRSGNEQLSLYRNGTGSEGNGESGTGKETPGDEVTASGMDPRQKAGRSLANRLYEMLDHHPDEPVLVTTSREEQTAGDRERQPVSLIGLGLLDVVRRLLNEPEGKVLLLDGNNQFSPYTISRAADRLGLSPHRFLERVEMSRAFTCHQMWHLLCEELPVQMKRIDTVQAVFVLDLLATFYDEDVSRKEALYLLKCCREKVGEMSGTASMILLEHPPPNEAEERADFRRRLGSVCPARLRLESGSFRAEQKEALEDKS